MSQLYGLFKQGTQDPPFDKTTAPGMFEIKVRLQRCDTTIKALSAAKMRARYTQRSGRYTREVLALTWLPITGKGEACRVGEAGARQGQPAGCAEEIRDAGRVAEEEARFHRVDVVRWQ